MALSLRYSVYSAYSAMELIAYVGREEDAIDKPKEPTSEPAASCSPGQREALEAFVQPGDLPALAASYKASPGEFRRRLAGFVILEACRGQSPAEISKALDDHEIRIHRDNISVLLAT